jgi:predicted CXXCH cytochrome family protein
MQKRLGWIALLLLPLVAIGCSDDKSTTGPVIPELAYVGSATCGAAGCHQATHSTFIESGHPYKLTQVVGGQGPVYPWDAEHTGGGVVSRDGPPPGTNWSQFAYVIGGFFWKARWVDTLGMVHTTGTQAQLNLQAPGLEWVPYNQGKATAYNYDCFKCHTTGADPSGSWPAGSTGFGTFAFGGVQCEACHGQGSQHAVDPARFAMDVNTSSTLCGQCHTRDAQNRVAVSGGYIQHHEQYDELVHSPHAAVGCGGCHDPHASVVYDDVAAGSGVTAACLSCHTGYDVNLTHLKIGNIPECTDCHMPLASKSGRVTANPYVADVHSHTFQINTASVDKSAMWTSDGKFLAQDEYGRGRITLDFACYSCHKDDASAPTNPTAPYSARTLAQLSAKAATMHGP